MFGPAVAAMVSAIGISRDRNKLLGIVGLIIGIGTMLLVFGPSLLC
ncbi:MAG TPA: hypothetical protein VHP11_04660 [Tepidisphaeraceae bacterium]|nr:hypothetical protein [Tepidisphaeraceae bacterium]